MKCINCKWSWNIEKSDDDPYLCHKCGYNSKINRFNMDSLQKWKESYYNELKPKNIINKLKYIKTFEQYILEKNKIEDDGKGKPSETPKGKDVKGEYLTAPTEKDRELMKKEIDKHSKKDDDDASAYKDWPADYKKGDTSGKRQDTKKSPATIAYQKKYGKKNESHLLEDDRMDTALKNKEEETDIPYDILKQVHNRGMAAWKTGHKPGVPQAAWAMGRVNSFITGEGGARDADEDLWKEHKKLK